MNCEDKYRIYDYNYHVYFLQAIESCSVKIGVCKGHPEKRLKTLQTGCPDVLYVAGWIAFQTKEAAMRREKALHGMFKADKIRGEWFSPSEYVMWYIREYGS